VKRDGRARILAYPRRHGLFRFYQSNRVEIEFDPSIEAPVKSISLRLPREMLNELKVLANKKDIPYQSLIKVYLAAKIAEERKAG
jgi:predicted DNA binding CopG/RHH family protein